MVMSEQIAVGSIFYSKQVFVFYILEWYLLITRKKQTLLRSTNPFSKNHPTLFVWLVREGQQMHNNEDITGVVL